MFTIRLGLLFFPLAVFGQAVNSSPSLSFPSNAAPITTLSPSATALRQAIEQIVPAQGVGAVSQSTNLSATAVAQAATAPAPAPTVTPSAAPQLAIGMTIKATDTVYARSAASPNAAFVGDEAPGSEGVVIGGPVSAGGTAFWRVAFYDDLTGWTGQGGLAAASPGAPTLSFHASPRGIAPGASSTLSWSSTNATSCSGTGFSPSGVSGSRLVSPTASTTYSITCTGSGGSTTRRTSVIVNPPPDFSWTKSLPVTFNSQTPTQFTGTEMRSLAFVDGVLYAGIGDFAESKPAGVTNGAMILRLDSPGGSWYQDGCPSYSLPPRTGIPACPNTSFLYVMSDGGGTNKFTTVDLMYRLPLAKDAMINQCPVRGTGERSHWRTVGRLEGG